MSGWQYTHTDEQRQAKREADTREPDHQFTEGQPPSSEWWGVQPFLRLVSGTIKQNCNQHGDGVQKSRHEDISCQVLDDQRQKTSPDYEPLDKLLD
jgi:hypothetical protein